MKLLLLAATLLFACSKKSDAPAPASGSATPPQAAPVAIDAAPPAPPPVDASPPAVDISITSVETPAKVAEKKTRGLRKPANGKKLVVVAAKVAWHVCTDKLALSNQLGKLTTSAGDTEATGGGPSDSFCVTGYCEWGPYPCTALEKPRDWVFIFEVPADADLSTATLSYRGVTVPAVAAAAGSGA
jgi:hypothetical protein